MAGCPCREATAHVHAEILLLAAEISASFSQCSNFTAGGGGSAAAKDEACIRVGFKHSEELPNGLEPPPQTFFDTLIR